MIHQVHNCAGDYNYNAYVYHNMSYDSHFHENYELIYVSEGTVDVMINTEKLVLYKDELLLIAPNAVHSLDVRESSVWVGVFSRDYIPAFAKENEGIGFSKFSISEDNLEYLKKHLFYAGTPKKYTACACLYMVCDECLSRARSYTATTDSDFIGRVTRYIADNLGSEIDMRSLCDVLGYEYHYFSGLFNSAFGMNFKSFVNMYKIGRACTMLAERTKSITEVCCACGFGSIRSFNRAFQRYIGQSPSQYRESLAVV